MENTYDGLMKRTQWFRDARFGMFIHWGLYAIPARGEWVRSVEKISIEDYEGFFKEFNPVKYNPKEWAKAAKAAGMRYVVMTTKHHDGFCLFDSKLTDYKATNTPAGRDLIREYVDAFREEGLKIGFYYSLLDWHHEGYPVDGDPIHPMREKPEFKSQKRDFSRYVEYFHGQVKELLTNYGKIDIMWFDFSYDSMRGEKWEATKLIKMIRELQPDIVIDNRLGGNIKAKEPEIFAGDFASPEKIIPPACVINEAGKPLPWESCITLNNNWGYNALDKDYKPSKQIIRALAECVSKGGNLLLNVGPTAKGEIPQESLEILSEVGNWMRANGESIYGCGQSDCRKPEWGRFTQKGNKLYAHILDRGIGPVNLNSLNGKVGKARLLSDGSEVSLAEQFNTGEYPEDAFMDIPNRLPNDSDTVVELELLP